MKMNYGAECILHIASARSASTLGKDHPTSLSIETKLQAIRGDLSDDEECSTDGESDCPSEVARTMPSSFCVAALNTEGDERETALLLPITIPFMSLASASNLHRRRPCSGTRGSSAVLAGQDPMLIHSLSKLFLEQADEDFNHELHEDDLHYHTDANASATNMENIPRSECGHLLKAQPSFASVRDENEERDAPPQHCPSEKEEEEAKCVKKGDDEDTSKVSTLKTIPNKSKRFPALVAVLANDESHYRDRYPSSASGKSLGGDVTTITATDHSCCGYSTTPTASVDTRSLSKSSSASDLSASPLIALSSDPSFVSPVCESAAQLNELAERMAQQQTNKDGKKQSDSKRRSAEALYRCSLAAYIESVGSQTSHILRIRLTLALLYEQSKKDDLAEEQYRRILQVLEGEEEEGELASDSFGPKKAALSALMKDKEDSDAILAEAKMRLALCLARQRKYENAEVCFRELLIHREVTLSYSHPLTMIARGLLLHFLLRKHVGWQEEDDREEEQDQDHNLRKMSCNTMAAIAEECVKKGELSGAETMYRRIIQTSEFTLGRDSPTVIIAVERLAQIYFSDEKFEAAEEMFRRVYMSYTHTLGTSHERTLNAQVTYALTLFSNGKLDESEIVYHDALMKFEQTFGEDCAETLQVTADFAILLSGERRIADAVFYFKRALKGYEHLLGCDHSVTVSLRAQLLSIENESIK